MELKGFLARLTGRTTAAATARVRADLVEVKVDGLAKAKEVAIWLTKGQDRRQPATAVLLRDCTTDHLQNILANIPDLTEGYRRVITSLLEDRGVTVVPQNFPNTITPFAASDDDGDDDTFGQP